MESYSPIAIDHYTRPRNAGRLPDASGIGEVEDAATDTLVVFYVRLAAGRVAAASFRTIGCNACIAASSIATELVRDRTVAEARALDARALDQALGGLPASKRYCAELVARALAAALDQAAA